MILDRKRIEDFGEKEIKEAAFVHLISEEMGCFPCFDSREEEKLNPAKESDDRKHSIPDMPSNISKLSSG